MLFSLFTQACDRQDMQGQTVQVQFRVGERDPARVRALIHESVAEAPAVLVVATSSDLVEAGIVQSLARPGGNITRVSGLTLIEERARVIENHFY